MKKLKITATETAAIRIIAEIGTSHNGSLSHARELIDAAAESGADCLKTQIVFADEIIHPNTGEVALPGGNIRLFDRFRELEQNFDFYLQLKQLTEKRDMSFLASPFGLKSLEYIIRLGCDEIKIASPELNHFPLLRAAADTGKKLLLSTGVSELRDIQAAIDITGKSSAVLFHCITSYPAPEAEYNLNLIPFYKNFFGTPAGVSDHSRNPLVVPSIAAAVGAQYIEKHFTLSESGNGLDDRIALTPADFASMVKMVRRTEKAACPLEMVRSELGAGLVDAVLGDGVKRLAPAESANYGRTNRSIHALIDLAAGDLLSEKNTALLRTEKKLRPGLRPEFYDSVLGRKLKNPVDAGEGITAEDLS